MTRLSENARTPPPTARDHRDLCIEHLMADLLVAENRLVEAVIDALAYRALAQQAMHRLHERECEIERLQQTIGRLRDAQAIRDAKVAA